MYKIGNITVNFTAKQTGVWLCEKATIEFKRTFDSKLLHFNINYLTKAVYKQKATELTEQPGSKSWLKEKKNPQAQKYLFPLLWLVNGWFFNGILKHCKAFGTFEEVAE